MGQVYQQMEAMTIAAYPHPDGLFKIKVDQIRALTVYGAIRDGPKGFRRGCWRVRPGIA
jgi:hypothetical protein